MMVYSICICIYIYFFWFQFVYFIITVDHIMSIHSCIVSLYKLDCVFNVLCLKVSFIWLININKSKSSFLIWALSQTDCSTRGDCPYHSCSQQHCPLMRLHSVCVRSAAAHEQSLQEAGYDEEERGLKKRCRLLYIMKTARSQAVPFISLTVLESEKSSRNSIWTRLLPSFASAILPLPPEMFMLCWVHTSCVIDTPTHPLAQCEFTIRRCTMAVSVEPVVKETYDAPFSTN